MLKLAKLYQNICMHANSKYLHNHYLAHLFSVAKTKIVRFTWL